MSNAEDRPQVVLVNRCFVIREDGQHLIIKRSPKDRHNPGKWEVPGGKVDIGQNLICAMEREVMEETGLIVKPIYSLVFIENYIIPDGPYEGLNYLSLFHITQVSGGRLVLSEEHSESAWVDYSKLMSHDLTKEVKKAAVALENQLTIFPSFPHLNVR